MTYELIAYNTDCRYPTDIRYRKYTTSKRIASDFEKIHKIQFTDSGHGIVFVSREYHGRKSPENHVLWVYVQSELLKIRASKRVGKLESELGQ